MKNRLIVALFFLMIQPASAQDWFTPYIRATDNQTSVMTTPTQTMSSATACTSASPSVFTWASNALQNGMAILLSGTVCTGFTAGTVYYVVNNATDGAGKFRLAATVGGTAINATSAQTPTSTIVVTQNALIANASNNTPGAITVPSILNVTRAPAGSFTGRSIRLLSNVTSGWDQSSFTVRLYSTAPTYTAFGNFGPWTPATGATALIGQYNVTLTQFGDGASGRGSTPDCGPIFATLIGGGSTIYWDLQYTGATNLNPVSGQTFTVVFEEEK